MISYYDGLQILSIKSVTNSTFSVTLHGTGRVLSSEKAVLAQLYQKEKQANNNVELWLNGLGNVDPSQDHAGSLKHWNLLVLDQTFDPCISRMYGILCEAGRVVWINCYDCKFVGEFLVEWTKLDKLIEMDFSQGNSFHGSVPCEIQNLKV